MRIVLDTNVLARPAYSSSGPAAAVLELVKNSPHLLVTSPFVLDELDRVLRYPRLQVLHGFTDHEIGRYVNDVQAASLVVEIETEVAPSVVKNDSDDDPIIATAEAGNADVICTLDKHLRHQDVQDYCQPRGIRILTDAELLGELRAAGDNDVADRPFPPNLQ